LVAAAQLYKGVSVMEGPIVVVGMLLLVLITLL